MIFQITEDFFSDNIHHVRFPLSPFTGLLLMYTWLSLYSVMVLDSVYS